MNDTVTQITEKDEVVSKTDHRNKNTQQKTLLLALNLLWNCEEKNTKNRLKIDLMIPEPPVFNFPRYQSDFKLDFLNLFDQS